MTELSEKFSRTVAKDQLVNNAVFLGLVNELKERYRSAENTYKGISSESVLTYARAQAKMNTLEEVLKLVNDTLKAKEQ